MSKEHPPHPVHVPVLLESTVAQLDPAAGESYLDLTAGYGGHAKAVLDRTGAYEQSVLVDRDASTARYLDELVQRGASFLNLDFLAAARRLEADGRRFDLILADLGVSSPQLDRAERGFSFRHDGPLDMRMDDRSELTADLIVNTYREHDLAELIVRYGEEPRRTARTIAGAIVSARPVKGTLELANLIAATVPSRWNKKRIHPATRTFQALRIEVNDELRQVEQLLPILPNLLNRGGRVAIISFHSLEDRLVKRYFAEQTASGYEAELQVITKRPLDGATYDVHNPRSRSAKLRVAVKT